MAIIEGTLLYTQIQKAVNKYKDDTRQEFKVSICVDEDTADKWEEEFPKQPAKATRTSDFEDQYKVEAPFPDAKKQYVITLKRDAQYKDGAEIDDKYKPKVFVKNDAGKLVDITKTKLVANGSYGVVSYEVRDTDYGPVAKLKNVRVDNLIEYVDNSGPDTELGEFDDSVGDSDFDNSSPVSESKPEVKPKETNRPAGKPASRGAPKGKTGNAVADLVEDSPF